MIRGIVGWSVGLRLLIVVMAAALLLLGIQRLREMPVDVYPEFAPVSVEVQSEALGLSASEVAEMVTVPLEADLLNTVPWVDIIRSESVPGLSSIEMIFEPGTDPLRARQVVQERLSEALVALPGVSRPPQMLQPVSSANRVMMIGFTSQELTLIDMSVLARWNIRPRLMGVPGVANVAIWGQREQQLQVLVDPQRLQTLGVPLSQVIESTANALWSSPLSFVEASTPGTGGWIDTPNQRLGVQHISPITTPGALAQVTLHDQPALRLSDVANVVEDHQPLIGDAIINDGPGLLLVVEKFPGTNTLEVTRAVEDALDDLRPGLSGIQIDSNLYRPASYIHSSIDNLTIAAIIAAALMVLVLAVFLFDWRTAVIGAVTVPLSLIAAAVVLDLRGESLNLITVAGLLMGLIIILDDVVTGVHSIRRRLHERHARATGETAASVIIDSVVESHSLAIFGILIIVITAIPLFFLEGIAGAFFPELAVSYILAVVVSLVVALTVMPVLAVLMFPSVPARRRESPVIRRLHGGYSRALGLAAARLAVVFGIAGILVVAGLALTTQLSDSSLLPTLKERDLLVEIEGAPGTSQPEMTRLVTLASNELGTVRGVTKIGAHIGRAITSDQVVNVNSAALWVGISPDVDYEDTLSAILDIIDGYPGLATDVHTYSEERVQEILTASDKDITIRVYGERLDVLQVQADQVLQVLSQIEGVEDPRVEFPIVEPTVRIEVDLAAAQRHGLTPGDVRRSAAVLLSGIQVGSLFEGQKVFEVVVWSTPETRSSLTSIGDLLIGTPAGQFIRLGEVADVRIEPHPTVVKREAVSRYLDVTANANGRSISSIKDNIDEGLGSLNFPIEYHAELLGEDGRQGSEAGTGFREIIIYAIAAAVGIFLLFQAAFNSWRLATVAIFVVPTSIVGGIIAVVIDGGAVTIGTYAGFFALLGLSARSGLSLFNRYLGIQREEGLELGRDLMLQGAQERVAPVLMTALAAVAILLPLIVAGPIAGFEVVYPFAVVVVGGLLTTTLFSLFVLPALYLHLGPKTAPEGIDVEASVQQVPESSPEDPRSQTLGEMRG